MWYSVCDMVCGVVCGMWYGVCDMVYGMWLQMHTVTGGRVRLYDHCSVSAFHRELFGYSMR